MEDNSAFRSLVILFRSFHIVFVVSLVLVVLFRWFSFGRSVLLFQWFRFGIVIIEYNSGFVLAGSFR